MSIPSLYIRSLPAATLGRLSHPVSQAGLSVVVGLSASTAKEVVFFALKETPAKQTNQNPRNTLSPKRHYFHQPKHNGGEDIRGTHTHTHTQEDYCKFSLCMHAHRGFNNPLYCKLAFGWKLVILVGRLSILTGFCPLSRCYHMVLVPPSPSPPPPPPLPT